MSQQLATATPSIHIIAHPHERPAFDLYRWLLYWNPDAAVQSVIDGVETLPGSRHERHTMRCYLGSLADFCRFQGAQVIHHANEDYTWIFGRMAMPTQESVRSYLAHCSRRGLSSKTIVRYMAPVRHFLRALDGQAVYPQSGEDFMFILEAQRQFRLAYSVHNPKMDRKSNRPDLENYGIRLTVRQVNDLLATFEGEMHTLAGKRDLALIYLGITSGLRAAELARLTPANITRGEKCWEIRVRGKGSNTDPVGIDDEAYGLVVDLVAAWNAHLAPDDPRRIGEATPVFQPLFRGDHIWSVGHRGYAQLDQEAEDAIIVTGLNARAIRKIVERRTRAALGFSIAAHDMRRTCAYLLRSGGAELDVIRSQLRHVSLGTTEKYIGKPQDLSQGQLSRYVKLFLPRDIHAPVDQEAPSC